MYRDLLLYQRLKRRMRTSGRSTSTLNNYARHLAKMVLHFNCAPFELEDDQVEDYLSLLQQEHDTLSESYFKHTVNSKFTGRSLGSLQQVYLTGGGLFVCLN